MRYGVVGVGYFGADLARFMNEFDDAQIQIILVQRHYLTYQQTYATNQDFLPLLNVKNNCYHLF